MAIDLNPDSPLSKYYAAVDGGDFDTAVAQFAENAMYVVPSVYVVPTVPGSPERSTSAVYRGRLAIAGYFAQRGPRAGGHKIRRVVQQGDLWFVEGFVPLDPGWAMLFASVAQLDDTGLIRSYTALATVLSMSDIEDLFALDLLV